MLHVANEYISNTFVATPNSLTAASFNFFPVHSTTFSLNATPQLHRHRNCVSLTLRLYHVVFCSVGWIEIRGGGDPATIRYRASINYFTQHTLASKRDWASIQTRLLFG